MKQSLNNSSQVDVSDLDAVAKIVALMEHSLRDAKA
jgi:hypothetical protein